MSYTSELKREMCTHEPHKNCCSKAYINGFLIAAATHAERHVTMRLSGKYLTDAFLVLLDRVLHATAEVTPCRGGGETNEISFVSNSAAKYLEEIENIAGSLLEFIRCKECRKWFLRGIFLSVGNLSDPEKGFRLDMTPRYHTESLVTCLTELDLKPLESVRRGKRLLYYRSGEIIGDFFAMMGEMETYFSLQDEFFKRELSNLTNRQNNCVVSNIMRSVTRSGELIDLLTRMKEQNKLSLLPDDLRATAELRLAYPDYTLSRLAAVSVPPLTKSGLNHRLNRILEIARKLDL